MDSFCGCCTRGTGLESSHQHFLWKCICCCFLPLANIAYHSLSLWHSGYFHTRGTGLESSHQQFLLKKIHFLPPKLMHKVIQCGTDLHQSTRNFFTLKRKEQTKIENKARNGPFLEEKTLIAKGLRALGWHNFGTKKPDTMIGSNICKIVL